MHLTQTALGFDPVAFLSTPRGLIIAAVVLIALFVVIKIAGMIVRILALLVSLATIAWIILRAKTGT